MSVETIVEVRTPNTLPEIVDLFDVLSQIKINNEEEKGLTITNLPPHTDIVSFNLTDLWRRLSFIEMKIFLGKGPKAYEDIRVRLYALIEKLKDGAKDASTDLKSLGEPPYLVFPTPISLEPGDVGVVAKEEIFREDVAELLAISLSLATYRLAGKEEKRLMSRRQFLKKTSLAIGGYFCYKAFERRLSVWNNPDETAKKYSPLAIILATLHILAHENVRRFHDRGDLLGKPSILATTPGDGLEPVFSEASRGGNIVSSLEKCLLGLRENTENWFQKGMLEALKKMANKAGGYSELFNSIVINAGGNAFLVPYHNKVFIKGLESKHPL